MQLNSKEKIIRKQNNIKNSISGITLIALVVTIIVLIILAGVSINLVLGENGIITMAKKAKENMEIAQTKEEEMLNTITNYVENEGKIVIEGPVAGGSYDNPYIPAGFTHTEGEGTWNSGYVIKEKETGNVFVWVPCVLDQAKVKDGDNVQTFKKTLPSTTDTTDPYYMYNKNNYTITGDESPANLIKTSVGTYGGFYIAAYEAGIEGTTENYALETKTATDGSVKPLSKADCGVWNYITRANALIVAANMVDTTDGVKSGLISGECWDTTLQWMVNSSSNAATNAGYDTNSEGKGWYSDVSSSTIHTTGYYAINNIYDMAGNVWEMTTENYMNDGNSYLVLRGGNYFETYTNCSAASRIHNKIEYIGRTGFRVVLYKNV